MIAYIDIIRVGYPETRWHLICVKHTKRSVRTNCKIPEDLVLCFYSILHEVGMSLDEVGNVIGDS